VKANPEVKLSKPARRTSRPKGEAAETAALRQELLLGHARLSLKYANVLSSRSNVSVLGNHLLQSSRDGVALFEGGRLCAANRCFYELCGTSERFRRFEDPDLQKACGLLTLLGTLLEDFKRGAGACWARHVLEGDGGLRLEATLERHEESPDGIMVALRDVSDKLRLERERHDGVQHDALLALLADDLQRPLQVIQGAAESLRGEVEMKDVAATAEIIRRQAAWQSQIVNALSDLSQVRRGALALQPGPCDLRQLLKETLEVWELLRSPGVNLRLALPRRSVRLIIDRERIRQAIVNLLVIVARLSQLGEQNLLWLEVGKLVWIRLHASGIGVSSEMVTRMWLTKQLVELHGGGVRIDPEGASQGIVLSFYLPLNKIPRLLQRRNASAPSRTDVPGGPPNKRRVLFIDDNADLCELMSFLFEQAGHKLLVAKDGVLGLEMARRERPDVVICDLALPRLDGLALAGRLHKELPGLPLIALSGYADVEMQERAMQVGFTRYIIKPITTEALFDAMNSVIAAAEASRRPATEAFSAAES
jgi:CheY-like chemotaxis protein/signal transduction histidine kinase